MTAPSPRQAELDRNRAYVAEREVDHDRKVNIDWMDTDDGWVIRSWDVQPCNCEQRWTHR